MALLLAVLYLVYGFFVLYVIVQMVLRLALIDLLLALAPIALGLWILPHTAGWGRHWLQPLHDHGVPAGHPAHRPGPGLRLPQRGRGHRRLRAGAGPDLEAAACPWPSSTWRPGCRRCWATPAPSTPGSRCTLYFGMNLPSSLARSARTIGTGGGRGRRGAGGRGGGRDGGQRGPLGCRKAA